MSIFSDIIKILRGEKMEDNATAQPVPSITPAQSAKQVYWNDKFLRSVESGDLQGVKHALKNNANVNSQNEIGRTALMIAASKNNWGKLSAGSNHWEVFDELLAHNPEVNATDNHGRTILMLAIADHASNGIIETMIDIGVDVNIMDNQQWNALLLLTADQSQRTYLAEKLIAAGSNVNVQDGCGETALMFARHDVSTVEVLIANNAKLNLQNDQGNTALHKAVSSREKETVQALVNAGANLDLRNGDNETALDIAKSSKHVEIIEILEEALKNRPEPKEKTLLEKELERRSQSGGQRESRWGLGQ